MNLVYNKEIYYYYCPKEKPRSSSGLLKALPMASLDCILNRCIYMNTDPYTDSLCNKNLSLVCKKLSNGIMPSLILFYIISLFDERVCHCDSWRH